MSDKKLKIITVLGARPQFIKAAALSRELKENSTIKEIIIHTGQHFDKEMSDIFFLEMEIPLPNYQLAINSLGHGAMTGRMLEEIEKILIFEKPDGVLVYGDTNSTLAGALAAAKLHIPVFHVEAGLRSFNKKMPEEINRVLTDHISELLFTPTDAAIKNLNHEGISEQKIKQVGDIMYDAVKFYTERAIRKSNILKRLKLNPKEYILTTIHRAENTDDFSKLNSIINALLEIGRKSKVVLPLHPRTKNKLIEEGILEKLNSSICITEPLGYFDMLLLEKNSSLIITDSGGIQKEAFFEHVPCITLREETEWVELVSYGFNKLVPPLNSDNILKAVNKMLNVSLDFDREADLFGNGDSASKIKKAILDYFAF